MKPTTFIAIDPGKSGGMAVRYPSGGKCTWVMPDNDSGVFDMLFGVADICNREDWDMQCCLEKAGGFAGVGHPGSRMFEFGRNYGFIIGVLMALKIPFQLIRPQQWQATLQLGKASPDGRWLGIVQKC